MYPTDSAFDVPSTCAGCLSAGPSVQWLPDHWLALCPICCWIEILLVHCLSLETMHRVRSECTTEPTRLPGRLVRPSLVENSSRLGGTARCGAQERSSKERSGKCDGFTDHVSVGMKDVCWRRMALAMTTRPSAITFRPALVKNSGRPDERGSRFRPNLFPDCMDERGENISRSYRKFGGESA